MSCRGRGSTHKTVTETVNIPKGVDNGVNLRMSKKGHAGQGGPAGDLMVHVKVRPHAHFKRQGSDIHTDIHVSLSQVSEIRLQQILYVMLLGRSWNSDLCQVIDMYR